MPTRTTGFDQLKHEPRVLLGPGPSNLHPRVAAAMSCPIMGYLDSEFLELMDDTMVLLRRLFQTHNALTITLPGTGMAAMEAAIANVVEPGDQMIVAIHGFFGQRMADIVERHGGRAIRVEVQFGQTVDPQMVEDQLRRHEHVKAVGLIHGETSTGLGQPLEAIGQLCRQFETLFIVDTVCSLGGADIPVDRLQIDICYSGGQKCIGGPAGIAPITLSDRAVKLIESRSKPVDTWYLDLMLIRKYWDPAQRIYHHTAPGSLLYALREALRLIDEETLAARVRRHEACSHLLKAGLEALGMELFGEAEHRLAMLTCVLFGQGLDDGAVRKRLMDEYRIEIAGGFGPLAGKAWRIGLMGHSCSRRNVHYLLAALGQILSNA